MQRILSTALQISCLLSSDEQTRTSKERLSDY